MNSNDINGNLPNFIDGISIDKYKHDYIINTDYITVLFISNNEKYAIVKTEIGKKVKYFKCNLENAFHLLKIKPNIQVNYNYDIFFDLMKEKEKK